MNHADWVAAPIARDIIIGSWALFIIVWGAMAFGAKKSAYVQPANERRRYTLPLLACLIFMTGVLRYVPALDVLTRRLPIPATQVQWAGAVAAVAGVAIAIWARLSLGRNWSGEVTLKEGHELVTSGPYGAIRHPIYTALILLFLGSALLIDSLAGLLGLACVIWSCWVKLRQEEALMLKQFPDSYPAYMARTKRLVPGLV